MSTSSASAVDSNAFQMAIAAIHKELPERLEVWSRFPLELDAQNIVTPHLYAWRRTGRLSRDGGTIAEPALFTLFAHRSLAHREFLQTEVVPRVLRRCPHVALVDSEARTFEVAGTVASSARPLAELGGVLRRWTGDVEAFERYDLSSELDRYEQLLGRTTTEVSTETAEQLERAPLRLWEALFLRGHADRYELLNGEVALVGDLGTGLAANRSLIQCTKDAEVYCGGKATEARGWIEAGQFRLRNQGPLLELRVCLNPADIRVAFMPRALMGGAETPPSLIGALLAGGDNGKTELMHGYTWSSIRCRNAEEVGELSVRFAEEIRRWTGAEARGPTEVGSGYPDARDSSWHLRTWAGDVNLLEVFVPMYRDGLLPWRAVG